MFRFMRGSGATKCAKTFAICIGLHSGLMASISHSAESNREPGKIEWYFAPRAWYFVDGSTNFVSSPSVVQASESVRVPMLGFSLGARFPSLPQSVFTLSAMRGVSANEYRVISFDETNLKSTTLAADYSRSDYEILAQTTFAKSTAHWIAGMRLETGSVKIKGSQTNYQATSSGLQETATTAIAQNNVSSEPLAKLSRWNVDCATVA